jgi:uncharacterized protein YhbP (UPF0306 family)
MTIPLREKVLAFLGEHHVMTLSTAGPQGPWAAAVFYAHDNLRLPLIGGGAGVPRKILEALQKIRWYELVPDDIYLIDNTLGFAHREHMPVK